MTEKLLRTFLAVPVPRGGGRKWKLNEILIAKVKMNTEWIDQFAFLLKVRMNKRKVIPHSLLIANDGNEMNKQRSESEWAKK